MVKQELYKTVFSKKSKIIFAVLLLIAISDNFIGISQAGPYGYYYNIHPAFVSLLSGQAGLVCYALYFWIMPISLMLLYCDRSVNENKIGIYQIYLTKSSRKKLFFSKIGTSFVLPFFYCGIPLLVNLVVYSIFLHNGTSFFGMEKFDVEEIGTFWFNSIHHPYITWFIYFFFALLMFGLLGILCQCISLITKDTKTSYIVSFAIWIIFFCSDYNIPMIIQPYTEYDLVYGFKTFVCFFPFLIVSFTAAYVQMVVKKDEI